VLAGRAHVSFRDENPSTVVHHGQTRRVRPTRAKMAKIQLPERLWDDELRKRVK
jgi:hypothetical protein